MVDSTTWQRGNWWFHYRGFATDRFCNENDAGFLTYRPLVPESQVCEDDDTWLRTHMIETRLSGQDRRVVEVDLNPKPREEIAFCQPALFKFMQHPDVEIDRLTGLTRMSKSADLTSEQISERTQPNNMFLAQPPSGLDQCQFATEGFLRLDVPLWERFDDPQINSRLKQLQDDVPQIDITYIWNIVVDDSDPLTDFEDFVSLLADADEGERDLIGHVLDGFTVAGFRDIHSGATNPHSNSRYPRRFLMLTRYHLVRNICRTPYERADRDAAVAKTGGFSIAITVDIPAFGGFSKLEALLLNDNNFNQFWDGYAATSADAHRVKKALIFAHDNGLLDGMRVDDRFLESIHRYKNELKGEQVHLMVAQILAGEPNVHALHKLPEPVKDLQTAYDNKEVVAMKRALLAVNTQVMQPLGYFLVVNWNAPFGHTKNGWTGLDVKHAYLTTAVKLEGVTTRESEIDGTTWPRFEVSNLLGQFPEVVAYYLALEKQHDVDILSDPDAMDLGTSYSSHEVAYTVTLDEPILADAAIERVASAWQITPPRLVLDLLYASGTIAGHLESTAVHEDWHIEQHRHFPNVAEVDKEGFSDLKAIARSPNPKFELAVAFVHIFWGVETNDDKEFILPSPLADKSNGELTGDYVAQQKHGRGQMMFFDYFASDPSQWHGNPPLQPDQSFTDFDVYDFQDLSTCNDIIRQVVDKIFSLSDDELRTLAETYANVVAS